MQAARVRFLFDPEAGWKMSIQCRHSPEKTAFGISLNVLLPQAGFGVNRLMND